MDGRVCFLPTHVAKPSGGLWLVSNLVGFTALAKRLIASLGVDASPEILQPVASFFDLCVPDVGMDTMDALAMLNAHLTHDNDTACECMVCASAAGSMLQCGHLIVCSPCHVRIATEARALDQHEVCPMCRFAKHGYAAANTIMKGLRLQLENLTFSST